VPGEAQCSQFPVLTLIPAFTPAISLFDRILDRDKLELGADQMAASTHKSVVVLP